MAVAKVVKYDGSPDIYAWKYPDTELGTWTQLIVNESRSHFVQRWTGIDWFGPGRHTLETANIPLLSKLVNLPFKGKSPFTAEVWFVNKVNTLDVKWGTPYTYSVARSQIQCFYTCQGTWAIWNKNNGRQEIS